MSVALPERSWPPHKVLLVMPDLQIFIISPPDNLIMQRSRIHFAPPRKPARDALFPDYFSALPAALYKPTRTPSIMLLSSLASSFPRSEASKTCPVPFVWGCRGYTVIPQKASDAGEKNTFSANHHSTSCVCEFLSEPVNFFFFLFFFFKKCFQKFLPSFVCVTAIPISQWALISLKHPECKLEVISGLVSSLLWLLLLWEFLLFWK